MVDRASFRRFNPSYKYPVAAAPTDAGTANRELDACGNFIEPEIPSIPQDGYANGKSTASILEGFSHPVIQ